MFRVHPIRSTQVGTFIVCNLRIDCLGLLQISLLLCEFVISCMLSMYIFLIDKSLSPLLYRRDLIRFDTEAIGASIGFNSSPCLSSSLVSLPVGMLHFGHSRVSRVGSCIDGSQSCKDDDVSRSECFTFLGSDIVSEWLARNERLR